MTPPELPAMTERQRDVYDYVIAHPGCGFAEIESAMAELPKYRASNRYGNDAPRGDAQLTWLLKRGLLRREGRPARWYPATPSD